jgi:hypothetical protein
MPAAQKFAIIDDLPKVRNGVATPESGSAPSSPPTMITAGMASDSAQPSVRNAV